MDNKPANPSLVTGEIPFADDSPAVFVKASPNEDVITVMAALGINKPATVLLLLGGAGNVDPALNSQIEQLLDGGLAPAAADTNALIVDGGTKAGVMALMGEVIARRGRKTSLLGIAPEGKVNYPGGPDIPDGAALDPNHSRFVLVAGDEWSSGTDMMFKVVAELAKEEARVVAVLINGGEETREEIRRVAELGWPVIAIRGSGRFADEVAARVTFANQGDFEVFDLRDKPELLRQLIVRHGEGALAEAWNRWAQYDSTSMANQAIHKRLLSLTLIIGVLGTLFALAQKQFTGLETRSAGFILAIGVLLGAIPVLLMIAVSFLRIFKPKKKKILAYSWLAAGVVSAVLLTFAWVRPVGFLTYAVLIFSYLSIAVPIVVSILVTGSNRFKNRRKWILLRESAETIMTEIFRYRTRVGDYADQPPSAKDSGAADANPPRSRDVILRESVVRITKRLMQTEVNTGSLISTSEIPPDGFGYLTPEKYLEVRLDDQLSWYKRATDKLERQRTEFQWLIYIVGGTGTLLAAFRAQLWVALTTATVTALTAWVSDLKLDVNLVKYNQAAAELSDLRYWWSTLSAKDKSELKHRQDLVNATEQVLASERASWVQQMEEVVKEVKSTTEESHHR